jgi:hypothetical protein
MGICDSLDINSIAIRPISCCFVISTRGDLREEISMADEAFALSPISARAAQPSDEDYAAISEAFMETSRGRWFLTEYARRNRNADTSMVLDAVARIEQSLAAQKEESLAAQREAAADTDLNEAKLAEARLAEAMAAIRNAVEAAQAAAIAALDGLALDEQLAPVRKGARVLREIAWRLREIGNDGRICDLIDSQVGVIEKGAEQISADDARTALNAAFATIAGRLPEFGHDATQAPVTEAHVVPPAPAQPEVPAAIAGTIEPESAQDAPQARIGSISTDAVAPAAEAPIEADAMPEVIESGEAVELTAEAADAHDDAVLDMIAMEMGAADPFDADEFAEPVVEEALGAEPPPVAPDVVAQLPEPVAAPVEPPIQLAAQPAVTTPEPALEISLGSSIIASGIVRRPVVAANDPLAPIRRMSQAEKIAFFS